MTWSTTPPTEPRNWYWWRKSIGTTKEIMYVTDFKGGLEAYVDGEFVKISDLGGEWHSERIPELSDD